MKELEAAVTTLKAGGVIAYPTEGVWGLGCDPHNEKAVNRILSLKRRPVEKGLILVAGSFDQLAPLLSNLAPEYTKLLESSWPGPHTWLIPDPDKLIPDWIRGQFDTVAVRVSDHPRVVDLCLGFGGMIVSTSANPADAPPAMHREEVESYFPAGVDRLVPGELGGQSGPSEIRDLMSQAVFR